MNTITRNNKNLQGFTLLELLIVVAIIAILSVALVFVLNPAESLKKARDSQRVADLNTLKTALGVYVTSTTTPLLGGTTTALQSANCQAVPGTWVAGNKIYYSLAIGTGSTTDITLDTANIARPSQVPTPALTDGSGWIPVAFDTLTGGSPISNLPVDPINTISNLASIANTDLVYRYGCAVTPLTFEIDAILESTAYTVADPKQTTDGGNNSNFYEVGTNLKIFGTGTDF